MAAATSRSVGVRGPGAERTHRGRRPLRFSRLHAEPLTYEAGSGIRARIEDPVAGDIEHVEEYDRELLEELQAVVCDEE